MAIQSMNEILKDEILESLQGSDSVLIKTITDLSSKAKPGADRVTIPNVTGLALSNVTPGSRAVAGGMATSGDQLLFNQVKQVPEYISWIDGLDSAIELKRAFLSVAPKVFAQGVEQIIATALATASVNDFESSVVDSFTIGDIANAKKLMDQAKIPKSERYLAVNASMMEILASMSEFQEGQKSLSPEALRDGVVSQVKGFKVVQSEDLEDGCYFYHKSAVAFALHSGVEYVEQMDEATAQEFISLRGKYGCKDVDNTAGAGKRKLKMAIRAV